ncbi:hypothetical protein V8E36_000812 [Tilletia maclaganii]
MQKAGSLDNHRADHHSAQPASIHRRRIAKTTPVARAAAATSNTVQPITIALPSGVALGKGHDGSNYVGTVILDVPSKNPIRPIPVVAIPAKATPPSHGSHRLYSSAVGPAAGIGSSTLAGDVSATEASIASAAAGAPTDVPTDAAEVGTSSDVGPPTSAAGSGWITAQHKPVFLALSAAGVVLLMLIAFMIGVCAFHKYPASGTGKRTLPAFLRRRRRRRQTLDGKAGVRQAEGQTQGLGLLLDNSKSPSPLSPGTEKDEDGFETHFFTPSIGYSPDPKARATFRTEKAIGTTSVFRSKEGKVPLPLTSKLISSVARGLAVSRANAFGPPPTLKYEEIIASPIITSPSAIFSPDISTLSAHSPREVQRWQTFPHHQAAKASSGGVINGLLIQDGTDSVRGSPVMSGLYPRDLKVTNGAPLSASNSIRSGRPSMIGLGLRAAVVAEGQEESVRAQHGAPDYSAQSDQVYPGTFRPTGGLGTISIVQSETAEVHENELSDFTMSQGGPGDTTIELAKDEEEGPLSTTQYHDTQSQPGPSLSLETIQNLTWRDVPEGSLRSGSPLRLGSCDNLAAISPSSSGMSLVAGRPAVPESVLRALEVTIPENVSSPTKGSTTPQQASHQHATLAASRRTGWHGAPGDTSSLASSSRRQMENRFPLPDPRRSREVELERRSTSGGASDRSEEMIVLAGIALDGISPIDVPSYPFSLWSATGASAPALASYAATLATIAASDAAAFGGQGPSLVAVPATDHDFGASQATHAMTSTPRKNRSAAHQHEQHRTGSPLLSLTPSNSSSAHSVLLLREQRLRSNLETIQRAESENALSLSPSPHRGRSGTVSQQSGQYNGSPRKTTASLFSLSGLSVREGKDGINSARASEAIDPTHLILGTDTKLTASNSPGRVARQRVITPMTTAVGNVPPTLGSVADTMMALTSCDSTPASSRSMDTIDTRASSPGPIPFSLSAHPHNIHTGPDPRHLEKLASEYHNLATRQIKPSIVDANLSTGHGNMTPVLTMLPSTTQLRMQMPMGPHILDGAMLALEEKEQQRLLAQHLLALHPQLAQTTVDVMAHAQSGGKKRKTGHQRGRDGMENTPASSISRSNYSHGSATASPTPGPTPEHHHALQLSQAGATQLTSHGILRDSTMSFANLGQRSGTHGYGYGGVAEKESVLLMDVRASGDPSERGSYVSPTLKLFQFYSPHSNSNSSSSSQFGPGSGPALGNARAGSRVHSQTSSGSGGLGLSLGAYVMDEDSGSAVHGPGWDSRPASSSTVGMGMAMPLPNFTAAMNGGTFVGPPSPVVRPDGVVDVFA